MTPSGAIPLAHFVADPPSVTFEPSNLTSAVLYELFTTIGLYPHNAAIAREDVVQVLVVDERFVFEPATATEHAAAIVAEFNCKITEFAAADPDYHSALITQARARADRGY